MMSWNNEDNKYDVMTMIMMSWQQLLWGHDNDYDVMTMIIFSWQWLFCHGNNYDAMSLIITTS